MKISIYAPIAGLGSDADYCGIGENGSLSGKLKDVENAYYIGIGTGIADAMKINGKLVSLDTAKSWMAKSWEILADPPYLTMEKAIAMPGIWQAYQTQCPDFADKDGHAGLVWEHAKEKKSSTARNLLEKIAQSLAQLIFDRMYTLAVGGTTLSFANSNKMISSQHPYLGKVWERVIIGQRMGSIWQNMQYAPFFQDKVLEFLEGLFPSLPSEISQYYKKNLSTILVASPMDYAPILGAALSAYQAAMNIC